MSIRVTPVIVAAVLAALLAAGVATEARAGSGLVAEGISIKNRQATVRVILPLSGTTIDGSQVFLKSSLRRLRLGVARLTIEEPGTSARVRNKARSGVQVELNPKAQALVFRATAAANRFKYLSYRLRRAPQRLVIHLWSSAPPPAGTKGRFGRRGCLALSVDSSLPGRLVVSGSVGRLFEATFVVRIRRADGRVIKRRIVTMQPGPWTQSIGYRVDSSQTGTVEAVAESAKDGSLDCLAQQRVALRPR